MNKIGKFTYLKCFHCGCSIHNPFYISKMNRCKYCDNKINYKDADENEILFDDRKFTRFILSNNKDVGLKYIIYYLRYMHVNDEFIYDKNLINCIYERIYKNKENISELFEYFFVCGNI